MIKVNNNVNNISSCYNNTNVNLTHNESNTVE